MKEGRNEVRKEGREKTREKDGRKKEKVFLVVMNICVDSAPPLHMLNGWLCISQLRLLYQNA